VTLSRLLGTTYLAIRSEDEPTSASAGSALTQVADRAALDAAASGWFYDAASRRTWVKLPATAAETTVELSLP